MFIKILIVLLNTLIIIYTIRLCLLLSEISPAIWEAIKYDVKKKIHEKEYEKEYDELKKQIEAKTRIRLPL